MTELLIEVDIKDLIPIKKIGWHKVNIREPSVDTIKWDSDDNLSPRPHLSKLSAPKIDSPKLYLSHIYNRRRHIRPVRKLRNMIIPKIDLSMLERDEIPIYISSSRSLIISTRRTMALELIF